MANYDLDYEGSEVQDILDTGKSLEDDGYIFLGTATPSTIPGTPTERVAYIGGPGTYNNFGTTVVVPSGSIVVITYSGSAWSKTVINASLPVSTTLGSDNTTIPTSKAVKDVTDAINTKLGEGYVYAGIATASTNPGTPTGKVFYVATVAGTYTNFGGLLVTQGINILKYNGTAWSKEQVVGIDDEPTAGSPNMVKSGGVQNELALGAVYDVSAKNPTAGPNNDGKFESLSALLSDANLNILIPTAYRKGGMSIKFVQSSDNKYIQYQYLGTDVTGTPNPFLKPENWVSVSDIINDIGFDLYQTAQGGGYIANSATIDVTNIISDPYFTKHSVTKVVKGQKIHIIGYSGTGPRAYIVTDLSYNALKVSGANTSIDETLTITEDGYLIVNYDSHVTCSAKYTGSVMSNIGDAYEQINGISDDLGLDIYNTAQDGGYIRNAEVIDITDVVPDPYFTKHSVTKVFKGQRVHIVGYSGDDPRAYIVTDLEYNRIKVSNALTSIDETLNINEDGYLIVNYDSRVSCLAKYVDSVMGNITINADTLEETINDIGFDLYRTAQYGGYIADADVIDINSVVPDIFFTKHSVTRVLKGQKVHIKGYSAYGPKAWITTDLNYNRVQVCGAGIPVDTDVNILVDGYIVINYDSRVTCSAKFVGSVMSNIVTASTRIEGIIESRAEGHYPIPMVRGKYSNTNVIGNVISLTPESDNTSKCACVDCAEGDMFIINAQGGNSPRAFSFLDDGRRVIYTCDASRTYTNEYIIAPEDSRYLLINDLSASKTSYKDWSLSEKVDPRKHSELVVNNRYYVAKFANYNKTDHSSIDMMTSAINGAYISQEAMKTQILLSNPSAKVAHDSRLVLKGDKLYCVFLENMVDTVDSAASVNAYVKIAIFDPSTMTIENEFVVAKNGDEVDGLTIISGAGVPNAVAISNGIRCFYGAELSDNEWYVLYRDFITSTNTFDVNKKAKFKVGNETLDFCGTTLNMIDSSFTSTMISMNSDIAFDSATGSYYTGVLQLNRIRSGIIVKSDDLDVFELWLEPTFSIETHGQYEASCAVYGNFLFYALRQEVSCREMVVAKFNLSTKEKIDEIEIVDAGSRPNWIKTENGLYLLHSINERNRTELLYVYPDILIASGIVWNTQNGFIYPSTVLYDNKIYFTYSYGGVTLSYLTSLYKYGVEDITKKLLGIF